MEIIMSDTKQYFMIHIILYLIGIILLPITPFCAWGFMTCLFAGQIIWALLLLGATVIIGKMTLIVIKADAKARALYARAKNN